MAVHRQYVKQKGIGLLAAVKGCKRGGVIAYTCQQGSYNRVSFMKYLEYKLLPKIRGKVLIMDNCSIHKGQQVMDLCNRFNVDVEFLPAYSPTKNPIENMFGKLKSVLKSENDRKDICTVESIESALRKITDDNVIAWTRHCGYRMGIHSQRSRRN